MWDLTYNDGAHSTVLRRGLLNWNRRKAFEQEFAADVAFCVDKGARAGDGPGSDGHRS